MNIVFKIFPKQKDNSNSEIWVHKIPFLDIIKCIAESKEPK